MSLIALGRAELVGEVQVGEFSLELDRHAATGAGGFFLVIEMANVGAGAVGLDRRGVFADRLAVVYALEPGHATVIGRRTKVILALARCEFFA